MSAIARCTASSWMPPTAIWLAPSAVMTAVPP
jgi:hypothetical protein